MENTNKRRYWLIFAVVGAIISFGAAYYLDHVGDSMLVNIPYLPAIALSIGLFGLDDGTGGIAPLIVFSLYGFVVGAFVGWLYGKIKNRKSFTSSSNV